MSERVVDYWQELHRNNRNINAENEYNNLQIVCCTGLSGIYNRMLHYFQSRLLRKAIIFLGGVTGKKILEVGCGTGRWSRMFLMMRADVSAIDISKETIDINKTLFPGISFMHMAAESMNFPDNTFDVIFSITVLQHIPYQKKESAIREIYRCLKTGGYAVAIEQVRPRKLPMESFENTVSFPFISEEWQENFERLGFRLAYSERGLFLPLILNVFFPLKRIAARLLKKRAAEGFNKTRGPGIKRLDNKINYLVTLLFVPLSFILEYLFIYVLRASRWTRQDAFGRHQTFIFKKIK